MGRPGAQRPANPGQKDPPPPGDAPFAAMFAASPSGMALVDADGIVVEINPAGLRILGAPAKAAVVGRPLRNWVIAEFQVVVEATLAQAFAGKSALAECRAMDPAGRQFWLELSASPVASPDRTGAGSALIVARDISQQRVAEERLRESEKLEAIGRLTGGVAHDFNNLLTVVIGNGELLSERLQDDPELRRMVDASLAAARAGAELTRMLLAYSRRQPLQPTDFCAARMIEEMRGLIERSVGDGMEIAIAADSEQWDVLADRAQLASAVLNLAINARDAMGGTGRIEIGVRNARLDAPAARASRDAAPGEYVLVSVTDSGTGIAPEILERVFEPFFTTKELGKGSGLGLSMVYGFARQSGGHVAIESSPGVGTSVGLYLPRAKGQMRLPNLEPELRDRAPKAGATVLLVEDNAEVRGVLSEQLRSLGYGVVAARDAREAIAHLRGPEPISLLLSDVVMPGMDGPALAERARRLRPGLPVILTSGFAGQSVGPGPRPVPANQLLMKPFSRRELAERVSTAIDIFRSK